MDDKRAQGGSRFNLRWSGSIPAGELTPEAVMKLLADYVDFARPQTANSGATPQQNIAGSGNGNATVSPTAQLKNGMKIDEVTLLVGQGRQISQTTGAGGVKTQAFEYFPGDRRAEVTYVNGVVVRFSISSR